MHVWLLSVCRGSTVSEQNKIICLFNLARRAKWRLWTDGKGRGCIDGVINDNGDIGRLIKSPEAPVSRKWPV